MLIVGLAWTESRHLLCFRLSAGQNASWCDVVRVYFYHPHPSPYPPQGRTHPKPTQGRPHSDRPHHSCDLLLSKFSSPVESLPVGLAPSTRKYCLLLGLQQTCQRRVQLVPMQQVRKALADSRWRMRRLLWQRSK